MVVVALQWYDYGLAAGKHKGDILGANGDGFDECFAIGSVLAVLAILTIFAISSVLAVLAILAIFAILTVLSVEYVDSTIVGKTYDVTLCALLNRRDCQPVGIGFKERLYISKLLFQQFLILFELVYAVGEFAVVVGATNAQYYEECGYKG